MDAHNDERVPVPIGRWYRRPRVRGILLGFVILACGIAIGGTTAAVVLDRDDDPGARRSGVHGPDRIVQKMREEYGLTDDQTERLKTVFREHWERLSAIRAEVQPRVDAEYEEMKREVEAVLTPEQAREWRQEFERKQRFWRSRAGKSSSPGHSERSSGAEEAR